MTNNVLILWDESTPFPSYKYKGVKATVLATVTKAVYEFDGVILLTPSETKKTEIEKAVKEALGVKAVAVKSK
jgi:hypothetical protein